MNCDNRASSCNAGEEGVGLGSVRGSTFREKEGVSVEWYVACTGSKEEKASEGISSMEEERGSKKSAISLASSLGAWINLVFTLNLK